MCKMSEAQQVMIDDIKERSSIARSVKSERKHKSTRSSVRLPSDNLTEKEIEALHGKCETYRLGEPMTWFDFDRMPNDLKVEYIQKIRKKFNAHDYAIAKMFDIHRDYFCSYINALGLKCKHPNEKWDADGFLAWANLVEADETESTCELAEDCEKKRIYEAGPIAFAGNSMPVLPKYGDMTFENNYADDVLKTITAILGNSKVNVHICWEIVEE